MSSKGTYVQASEVPVVLEPKLSGHISSQRISRRTGIRRSTTLVAFLSLLSLYCLFQGIPRVSQRKHSTSHRTYSGTNNPAYLITARHGAVASENKICSNIGVETLKRGGNAVDAAIATTFCIGVVNMFSSGIGGGGFMTVRVPSPNGTTQAWTIDFREVAPALANATMYRGDPNSSRFGGLAVGVPGEVRGLEEAHSRWGSLPWRTLVQPSVNLAKGWKVDAELAKRITWFPDLMLKNPDFSSIFAPNGRFLRENETIRRTNLSHTLEAIAQEGASAFYSGPIADSVVRKVRSTGGILSHADLLNYTVKVQPALEGTYLGRKIYTTHAPTSGPVLLHMLNLLEYYDFTSQTPLNVHRLVETLKFGFSARTRIGDPTFLNDTSYIHDIPSKEFAQLIFPNITDDRTHPSEYYNPEHDVKEDHGTSHSSVVDRNGMAVAITSTVNLIFGSQVMDPDTGVLLNDEMDDFSTPGIPNAFGLYPSPYNYPEAGKRPLSSTSPTIMEHPDGTFYLAIGGSGGSRIFPAVLQTILNLDWGMDVSRAIESGRLHHQLYPEMMDVDNTYPTPIIQHLEDIGHNVTVVDINRVAAVIQANLPMKLAAGLVALALSISSTLAAVPQWGQCGGIGWSGETGERAHVDALVVIYLLARSACASGLVCTVLNPYYSQCLTGSSAPASSSAPATSAPSSTPATTVPVPSSTVSVPAPAATGFVGVSGTKFTLNGSKYTVVGSNSYWVGLMSYSVADMNTAFSDIAKSGATVVRTWGFNEATSANGVYYQLWSGSTPTINTGATGLQNFDNVVAAAKANGIRLIVALTNNWADYGGMDVYVKQILGSANHDLFYTDAKTAFKNYIRTFVGRYVNEPTIMAWELGAALGTCTTTTITNWAKDISAFIKSIDKNHLVAIGDEGFYNQPSAPTYPYQGSEGVDFDANLAISTIDFGTFHSYPGSWGQSANPEAWGVQWIKDHAASMTRQNKPVILEEFGVTSDQTTVYTDWLNTVVSSGLTGDLIWQAGSRLTFATTPDDGYAVYPNTPVYTLLTSHAAALKARA
ncbi:hypothetical protein ONZ45_g8022 [Pleurotus djamor]|nr:hypothetical protein ONZ45_g8022 [Pleurotus djamor]